jgi:hypothetical protein
VSAKDYLVYYFLLFRDAISYISVLTIGAYPQFQGTCTEPPECERMRANANDNGEITASSSSVSRLLIGRELTFSLCVEPSSGLRGFSWQPRSHNLIWLKVGILGFRLTRPQLSDDVSVRREPCELECD